MDNYKRARTTAMSRALIVHRFGTVGQSVRMVAVAFGVSGTTIVVREPSGQGGNSILGCRIEGR